MSGHEKNGQGECPLRKSLNGRCRNVGGISYFCNIKIIRRMKKTSFLTPLLTAVLVLLSACGEDRTYEFVAKTEEDHWIEDQMRDVYLYYVDMPELEMENYFYPVDEFFPMLLASYDQYSYIDVPEEQQTRNNIQSVTYGFDFVLINDPTGTTTHSVARVLQVLPDSPAEAAGLVRGDFITLVNGDNVSSSSTTQLQSGQGVTLTVASLASGEDAGTVVWGDTRELTLSTAVEMDNNPFACAKVFEANGMRVGYLLYSEFRMGRDDNDLTDQSYMEEMQSVFSFFKQAGVTDFILDLRYNQGGHVVCAQEMASMLAPASALGQEFAHFVYNDKRQDLNYTLLLQTEYSQYNLNLDRLFIISGLYTASASEMMINNLSPHMEVNLIGTQTEGKNVAMTRIDSPYNFVIYPVTSTVYNSEGKSDYADGFTPAYTIDELEYYPWYDLGDERELLLYNTLQWIAGGTPPDAENQPSADTSSTRQGRFTRSVVPGYSSIRQKTFPAAILTD